jgi:hypothetical protein
MPARNIVGPHAANNTTVIGKYFVSVRFLLLVLVCFVLVILAQVSLLQKEVCSCVGQYIALLGQYIAHLTWFSWFLSACQDLVQ